MNQVELYYDENAEREWHRLERHRMEYAVTIQALHAYLPSAPATILDVGGGPGRYAIALARLGHAVTLLDISARSLEMARRNARDAGVEILEFVKTGGTDLAAFADGSFDVALLMGPLYHLLERNEREGMVSEAWRVLRPGGLVFATFITRYALIRDVVKNRPAAILARGAYYDEVLTTGRLTGSGEVGGFTDAYLVLPEEVRPMMEQGPFETLDLVGCEGVVSQIDDAVSELQGEAWDAWVEMNHFLGRHPSLYGASDHLLYVGRRSGRHPD